jgi:hypothetical protein
MLNEELVYFAPTRKVFKSVAASPEESKAAKFSAESRNSLVVGPSSVYFRGRIFCSTTDLRQKQRLPEREYKEWLRQILKNKYGIAGQI